MHSKVWSQFYQVVNGRASHTVVRGVMWLDLGYMKIMLVERGGGLGPHGQGRTVVRDRRW